MYIGLDKGQYFTCKEGKLTKLFSYGIIPMGDNDKAYCGPSDKLP